MRFNGAELRHMGAIGGKSTKEGILYVNEKGGKFWNKMDVLSQRWFRLVSNLLFYLKTNFKNSEPVGVYILENCRARPSEENRSHEIVLEFAGDQQIVVLTCDSAPDAKDWINKINNASYVNLKHKYNVLMSEITKRKKGGQRHIAANVSITSTPVSVNLLQSSQTTLDNEYKKLPGGVMGMQLNEAKEMMKNSLCPVLELALRGVNLQIDNILDHDVSLWIRLSLAEIPQKFYTFHSQTEPVTASKNPYFMKTLSFFYSDNLSEKMWFRFTIYLKKCGNVYTLGSAICSLSDLLATKSSPTLPIQKNGTFFGAVNVCIRRQNLYAPHPSTVMTGNGHNASTSSLSVKASAENDANFNGNKHLEAVFSSAISRTYEFPDQQNSHVNVQEIMLETRLSFHIPLQYLKLCIDEDTAHVGSLENVGKLSEEWERRRQVSIESTKHVIKTYHEHLKHLTRINQAPFFKASVSKADKELDFVPINLHLQKMRVSNPDVNEKDYDIVTTGATAAHAYGFKEGGLVTLLQNSNSGKKQMNHFLCNFPMQNEVMKTLRNILTLHTQVRYYIEKLASFMTTLSATSAQTIAIEINDHLKNLGEKVCTLISLLSRNEMNESLEVFLNAKGLPAQQIQLEQSKWEEERIKGNLLFNDVVKHSDNLISIIKDTSPVERNEDQFSNLIGEHRRILNNLNTFVTLIVDKSHKSLTLLNLKQSPVNYNILYRRDVAFSHAISILACGVACKIYSNLKDMKFLKQIVSVGILLQVESLISTYKSEKGMLEDYIVGVYDLNSVTVQCVYVEDTAIESLLPTIHGSRNNVVMKLHFTKESFNLLPSRLKEGFLIKVCPVFFNIGVNEEQTIAETIGSTWLQEYVNMDSYNKLQHYFDAVKTQCAECLPDNSASIRSLPQLMQKLQALVHMKKNKNVEVLQIADEICHMLSGVRVTSCKSAKDRTAMAVTLEQAHILQKYHGVSEKILGKIISCMRSEGTRRENTLKNTGSRKYAFTKIQLMTFPQQYRPPDGTYGKGQT